MLFGDEVLSPDGLDGLSDANDVPATDRELAMARQLIDTLSADFDPAVFKDDYRARVLALIERKAAGEELSPPPAEAEPADVPDLMAALEASLAALSAPAAAGDKPKAAKKPAAKKPAASAKKPTAKTPAAK